MNNDKSMMIKSLPQPDGGEGASGRQGACSNVRAGESWTRKCGAMNKNPVRRSDAGTSPQHRMKSSIRQMARNVDWALVHGKTVGLPRESRVVSHRKVRLENPQGCSTAAWQSAEGILNRRQRAGSSRRRVTRPANGPEVSPRGRPERCRDRMVLVNESGK